MSDSIKDAIKQSKPFRSSAQEAVVAFLRTADVVRRVFEEVVHPYDLTLQQYNVLRILRGAGPDGLPTLEIGERLVERTPGVTRLVDRLEKKGLVERRRDADDRRRVICLATRRGLSLLEDIDPAFDAADDRALGMLSGREQTSLVRTFERIRRELEPAD